MMRARQSWTIGVGILLAACFLHAQTDAGNGVARVSLMRGEVTVQRGDSGELTEAAINAPLVTGDRILTGPGSRAELQFDMANFIRLSANSEVRMMELRPERYLLAVAEGTVAFSRIDHFDSEVEVNTPSVSVRPVQKGNFRVSVYADGTSEITVREGSVEVFTPSGVERLSSGRTMMVRGDRDNPEFQFVAQVRRDEFDNWNRDRDRLIRRSESYRYVDRSVPGAYELDAYGAWVNVAPYGMVWRPRVAVTWVPYRHGRWAWVDYWGWSWVSYDPWGWAPFHYGRWFHTPGYGWCWYPGGRVRHYYAPAVVGWFGIGNVSVGVGFGRVGWVPLAPHEPFHHWWGGRWGHYHGGGWRNNRTYVDNSVTIVNNTNITNIYRNSRVNNGYTVMDGHGFARGASVRHSGVGLDSLRIASSVRGPVPVTPDRGSLRFSDRDVNRNKIAPRLARTDNRQFHTRTAPSQVERASFDVQRGAMEEVQRQAFRRGASAAGSGSDRPGRGMDANGAAPSRGTNSTVATRPAEQGARSAETVGRGERGDASRGASAMTNDGASQRGGWRRFGQPVTSRGAEGGGRGASGDASTVGAASPQERGSSAQRGSDSNGAAWRRFGEPAGRGDASQGRSSEGRGNAASVDAGGRTPSRGSSVAGDRTPAVSEGSRSSSTERGSSVNRGDERGAWQSFGRGNGNATGESSGNREATGSRSSGRNSGGGGAAVRESSERPSRGASSGQQRLNVSPPIVRERGSGTTAAPSSGGRGDSDNRSNSGRGTTKRSDLQGSEWRPFERDAASGVAAQSPSPSTSRSVASSSDRDAFSRSSSPSRSDSVFRGSSGSSRMEGYRAPSRSAGSSGRTSGASPSFQRSQGSSPSMGGGRSMGSGPSGMSSGGRSSSGGSMSRGGGSAARSGGGSASRGGGRGRN
jgi:hypothetical protein